MGWWDVSPHWAACSRAGVGEVAAVSRKMSLRVVFTPGLNRTLLFLTPTLKGPNKRFPSALLSRGLTLIVQENSRNGLLLPRVPGHAPPPTRASKHKHSLAPASPTSVIIPSPGRQSPSPHFIDTSCSRALIRRPGTICLDQHTDLGAHWSS